MNYVSAGLPRCTVPAGPCEILKSLLDIGAYDSLVQHRLVQASAPPTRFKV